MRIERIMFGSRIKQLRLEKGYTQEMVGKMLECSQVMVSYYELGLMEPNISRLVDISVLYNVSLDYLLKGENP